MLDVWIAILSTITTLGMAYLGFHVTLHPANSPKRKSVYKWAFLACGLVLVLLTGLQSYRSTQITNRIEAQINQLVSQGRLSNQDAQRLLGTLHTGDKLSLRERLQIEKK